MWTAKTLTGSEPAPAQIESHGLPHVTLPSGLVRARGHWPGVSTGCPLVIHSGLRPGLSCPAAVPGLALLVADRRLLRVFAHVSAAVSASLRAADAQSRRAEQVYLRRCSGWQEFTGAGVVVRRCAGGSVEEGDPLAAERAAGNTAIGVRPAGHRRVASDFYVPPRRYAMGSARTCQPAPDCQAAAYRLRPGRTRTPRAPLTLAAAGHSPSGAPAGPPRYPSSSEHHIPPQGFPGQPSCPSGRCRLHGVQVLRLIR